MRPRRVAASVALIASLALVVVPGVAGSLAGREQRLADEAFVPVTLPGEGTSMAIHLDPQDRSAGALAPAGLLTDPLPSGDPPERPIGVDPAPVPIVVETWKLDPNISWYGPGFYGNAGACGMIPGGLTPDTIGVAHRTLPCGTKVTFKWNGKIVVARVIDRGPYVSGRIFDMTAGLCAALNHCFTGWIWYRIG
jgi:rare lipoprotein A (RlpA)-like double-psi beta-barrel protein